MPDREIKLQYNQPLRIAGALTVECAAGTVWLTSSGEAGDVFLHAGERKTLSGGGLTLIEAIGAGCIVRLHPPLSPWQRIIAVAKRRFLLSWLHEFMRAVRLFRRGNSVAG